MSTNPRWTSYAIAGAALLLVSIAGTLQATPISNRGSRGAVIATPMTTTQEIATSHAADLGNLIMTPINPRVLLVTGSGRGRGASGVYNLSTASLSQFYVASQKVPVVTINPAPSRAAFGVSVRDGGTTLLMLGGAFSLLGFLSRKYEARSA